MKKTFILAGLLVGLTATAQYEKRVGVNTDKPRASLEVKAVTVDDRTQGILFPHISDEEKKKWQPNDTTGLVAGTVIWNTDLKCLDYFDGEKWQCTDGTNPYYPPVNPTTDKTVKADVWDRTHYIGSFNHNGANIDGELGNTDSNILKLQIPYNQATVGKSYNDINVTRTVQDRSGANKTLTLNISGGTFNQAEGFLNATIKVGSGATSDVYKVKQLPANEEETITTFTFSINGNVSNVKLIASGGVLDKKFGTANYNHIYVPVSVYDNIYVPPTGQPYEKKWLNNNLGANYAKVGNNQHTQQATSAGDYNAYGSLFQWQRPADGHELVNWTSTTAELTATTTTLWDNPNWDPDHSKFILGSSSNNNNYSWIKNDINIQTNYHTLWQSGQPNNPCPQGYHPPTNDEWIELLSFNPSGTLNNTYWSSNPLRLSAAGSRISPVGSLYGRDSNGHYWSSSAYASSTSRSFYFNSEGSNADNYRNRANGFSVRCIAD